jgi:hypothetical protein
MNHGCERLASAFEKLAARVNENYRSAVAGRRGATEALADIAMFTELLEGELDESVESRRERPTPHQA